MLQPNLPRPVRVCDDEEIGGRIYLQACHLFGGGLAEKEKSRFFQHVLSVMHKLSATKYHLENYARLESGHQRTCEELFKTQPDSPLSEAFDLIFEIEAFLFQVKSSLDMLVKLLVPVVGDHALKTHTYGNKGEDLIKGLTAFKKRKDANVYAVDGLISLVTEDRDSWIRRTIELRDTYSHYSALRGLCFEPVEWPSGWIEARKPTLNGMEIASTLQTIYSNNLQFQQDFMALTLCLSLADLRLILQDPNVMRASWNSPGAHYIKWGLGFAVTARTP